MRFDGQTAVGRDASKGILALELWTWELRAGERFQGAAHPASTLELIAVEPGALSIAFDEVSYVIGTGASAGDRWAPVRRGALVLVVAYASALAASTASSASLRVGTRRACDGYE